MAVLGQTRQNNAQRWDNAVIIRLYPADFHGYPPLQNRYCALLNNAPRINPFALNRPPRFAMLLSFFVFLANF